MYTSAGTCSRRVPDRTSDTDRDIKAGKIADVLEALDIGCLAELLSLSYNRCNSHDLPSIPSKASYVYCPHPLSPQAAKSSV